LKRPLHAYGRNRRFGSVIKQYAPQLHHFLSSRLNSETEAQDLAQEAYLRLTRVARPELIRSPEAYLFRIASNLANERLLKRAQDPAFVPLDGLEKSGEDGDGAAFEGTLSHRAEIVRLEAILDEMPPLYRAVLLLRKRDGYSHAEIAEKLNIAPSTVHTYLKRALKQCRARWSE
jgi:RNA polymerase sigma-19 factor, ECF subfamily